MKIEYCLAWAPASSKKAFKSDSARSLFEDYLERTSHFAPTLTAKLPLEKESGAVHWICHTDSSAKPLTSEQISQKLSRVLDSGSKILRIMIGGPDGWNTSSLQSLKPDLLWNFGPLTLPHELAAIVAAEQIYRAWTILRHLPYHSGH